MVLLTWCLIPELYPHVLYESKLQDTLEGKVLVIPAATATATVATNLASTAVSLAKSSNVSSLMVPKTKKGRKRKADLTPLEEAIGDFVKDVLWTWQKFVNKKKWLEKVFDEDPKDPERGTIFRDFIDDMKTNAASRAFDLEAIEWGNAEHNFLCSQLSQKRNDVSTLVKKGFHGT